MTDGIIGMRVTLNTAKTRTLKYLPSRIYPIQNCRRPELFILRSALIVIRRIAMKSRRDVVGLFRVRKQIAR